ncbi:MAG: caspase family protein, partial [Bacteroidota bacterium]
SKSKKIKIKDGLDYKFARNGQILIFQTRKGFLTYDAVSLKEIAKFDIQGTQDFDVQGNTIAVLTNKEVILFDLNFSEKSSSSTNASFDRIFLHPDEKSYFTYVNTAKKGSSKRDYTLKYFPKEAEEGMMTLSGHSGFITNITFLQEGEFILSSSRDGQILIRKFEDKLPSVASLIPLKAGEWVATTPAGIYDASVNAYNAMHYTRGIEEFDLAQLKDLYYEPKLLPRVLGFKDEPLPKRRPLGELPPHPEIDVKHPQVNNGVLGVNVKNTGGGVSFVVIKINGKEVLRELKRDESAVDQNELSLDYTITGHPFMKSKGLNKVSVKAYNSDGSMSSPEKNLFVFGKKEVGKDEKKPKLYSLVVGTDDYPGETMDLTYAGKDANDFADALGVVGRNYYQDGNTEITRLNTGLEDKSYWPTKANIERELDRIEKVATAQDVLVIYLSGHGINYGEETEDFYYLTSEATDNMEDEKNRTEAALSSKELTEWIKDIPALQQVLIVDACHSGKLTAVGCI